MSDDMKFHNAYLILAHEDLKMLNLLTARLVSTGYVYIHLDLKSRINVNNVFKHPKVKVTKKIKVNWGGFSVVEATQLLAKQALEDGATRLTLLSGLSYPIVSDTRLTQFAKSSIEYVDAIEVNLETQTKAFRRRFTTGHFSFHLNSNLFGRVIRRLSREFWAKLPHVNPESELGDLKLTFGSQWWSVEHETYTNAMELLQKNPRIAVYFKKIECSDESFFGSLFSHVNKSLLPSGTTYVKWDGAGGPKSIEVEDLQRESRDSKFLFARKIRSGDKDKIEILEDINT